MTAQLASGTLLAYGPQGARQLATATLLSYSPPAGAQRVVASFTAPWAQSAPQAVETHAPMHHAEARDQPCRAPWGHGEAQQRATRFDWVLAGSIDSERSAPWQQFAHRLQQQNAHPWVVSREADAGATAPWGEFAGRPALTAVAVWVRAVVSDPQSTAPWGQYAGRPALALRPTWATARRADAERWIPWSRFGRPLDAGWGVVTPPGGPIVDDRGTILVPVRRAYIMKNEALLRAVEGYTALNAIDISLRSDVDSWAWSVEASLPASEWPLIMPSGDGLPRLLEAHINGFAVQFLAENISRERVFAKDMIKVSGRSKSAVLGDPTSSLYSYSSESAITANQAAVNAVTEVGVPLGWSIDWQIEDWLLPAGVWQHKGTPISAVQRLAAAAGGYVQSDPLLQLLRVKSRYPSSPWDWGDETPHVALPMSIVIMESTKILYKPVYNEVYVRGEASGVMGHVVKVGTTGGMVADTVVDDLITDSSVARQRGRYVLGDTGAQQYITLSLPINDDLGVMEVGQFIDVSEATDNGPLVKRGIVRAVSASYTPPIAGQSVEIEVHV